MVGKGALLCTNVGSHGVTKCLAHRVHYICRKGLPMCVVAIWAGTGLRLLVFGLLSYEVLAQGFLGTCFPTSTCHGIGSVGHDPKGWDLGPLLFSRVEVFDVLVQVSAYSSNTSSTCPRSAIKTSHVPTSCPWHHLSIGLSNLSVGARLLGHESCVLILFEFISRIAVK